MEFAPFVLVSVLIAALVFGVAQMMIKIRRAAFLATAVGLLCLTALPMAYRYWFFIKPSQEDIEAARKNTRAVIAASGGWRAFQLECDQLIRQNSEKGRLTNSNVYPLTGVPTIMQLSPRKVSLHSLPSDGAFVAVQIIGVHSTGGRGTPFYYLVVSSRETFEPNEVKLGKNLRAITNRIWEAY